MIRPVPVPLRGPRVQALVATAFVLVVSLLGIGNDLFWEDEANTVLFARNLLEFGVLTAWDGRNVIGYAGGTELSPDLVNVVMPPLQYYLAAAGMAVFGSGEFAARLPSVLMGAATVWVLAAATPAYLPDRRLQALPAVLMALSAAFLLFVPHARYFAAAILFTTAILWAWGRLAEADSPWQAAATGLASVTVLYYANFLMAPALVGALAPLLAVPRFRTRRHVLFLAVAAAWVAALIALTVSQPEIARRMAEKPPLDQPVTAALILIRLYVSSLSGFEFLPLMLLPALALPWVVGRCADLCEDGLTGMALTVSVALYIVLLALMTLRPVEPWDLGDMRYAVPLFPVIALISAIALKIAWRAARALAVVLAGLLVFTNVLHLSPLALAEKPPFRCTLCLVVHERLTDRTTGAEGYVAAVRRLPPEASVFVFPNHMTYAPMYALPDRRYCDQLDPDVVGAIPDTGRFGACVVKGSGCADYAVIGGLSTDHPAYPKPRSRLDIGACPYNLERADPVPWRDGSRPELPRHDFGAPYPRPYEESGILTYKRAGPAR